MEKEHQAGLPTDYIFGYREDVVELFTILELEECVSQPEWMVVQIPKSVAS